MYRERFSESNLVFPGTVIEETDDCGGFFRLLLLTFHLREDFGFESISLLFLQDLRFDFITQIVLSRLFYVLHDAANSIFIDVHHNGSVP